MEINGFAQTSNNAQSSGSDALSGLSGNFDNFLTLLTKQLQYQDPLSPMDTNQFTSQLVQFTNVEQAISTNKKLDQLIGLQSSNQAVMAVSFLGTTVEANSDQVWMADGQATIDYNLKSDATGSVVTIINAQGKPVRVETGDVTAGKHVFAWDGKDNNGQALPDGAYRVQVTAVDRNGDSVAATTSTTGRVDGVQIKDGQIVLSIGNLEIPLSDVNSVREAPQSA